MESPEETGRCQEALETLIEHSGDPVAAGLGVQQHLRQCHACERSAAEELALEELLERAARLAVDDGATARMEQAIMQALPRRAWRWRVLTLVPVGASALLAVAGALLVGGAPGSDLVHMLPAWSSRGWMAVLHSARDWAVAFDTIARNSELLIPLAFTGAATLLAGAGLTGLAATTLRLRKSSVWSRRV